MGLCSPVYCIWPHVCYNVCWLLESRPSNFPLSPRGSFSLRASTEQLGRGSWGPGVGPGRLLKYLIFSAWRVSEHSQTDAKISKYFLIAYPVQKDMKIIRKTDLKCKKTPHFILMLRWGHFTCVAVVLIKGLKVKRPCISSSKSSPAALNICSSGVPGNILKDT